MDVQKQNNPELQKVADLIGEIKFAMMATEEPDGSLRSRPMATMQMDADGYLWFFTGGDSPKIDELGAHRQLNLSYARPDKQDYVSVSGSGEVVRDKEKMTALWTPWIKPWFPKGIDDPDLVLLKVKITSADYWAAPGTAVMRMYGLAKGIATGKTDAMGEHKHVTR